MQKLNTMTDKPEVAQFDVGGRVFKTSRSLIDQHEDTMLARLVSDTWQEDPNKSVFIDRDGDIFAQVLNYLRYGSITLPDNIVKDMFLRDLDFYGIVPKEGSVKSASEGWASQIDDRRVRIKDYGNQMKKLQLEIDIEFFAYYCAGKYVYPDGYTSNKITIKDPSGKADKNEKLLWDTVQIWDGQSSNKEALSKAFKKYGLSLRGEGVSYSSKKGGYYIISVEKSE